jgi:hypothetical protein
MLLLSAPERLIDLPVTSYRQTRPSRWRLFIECLRHPIIAFVAWREQRHEPVLTDRQRAIVWLALLHGAIAALLT